MKFIFFILILLIASLYVHSETVDSADVDYCLAFRSQQVMLFRVKENNPLVIRMSEKPIECETPNNSYSVYAEIYFMDKSNKSILLKGSMGVGYSGGVPYSEEIIRNNIYLLDRDMKIDYQTSLSLRAFEMSSKKKIDIFRHLLLFKGKIVNGNIRVNPACKPHKLEYNFKFRARIAGECDCDFLKEVGERCE